MAGFLSRIKACGPLLLGELAELRNDLKSEKKERRKEAVKKIIASMTVGKDVR